MIARRNLLHIFNIKNWTKMINFTKKLEIGRERQNFKGCFKFFKKT